MNYSDTPLIKRICAAINRTGRARVTRNRTAFAVPVHGKRPIRFGLGVGGADIVGLLFGGYVRHETVNPFTHGKAFTVCFCQPGRAFALEVKEGRGALSAEQKAWHRIFKRYGGFVCVVSTVDDAMQALERAEKGLSE